MALAGLKAVVFLIIGGGIAWAHFRGHRQAARWLCGLGAICALALVLMG